MTTPTPTGAAELPKCTAADGSTEVINVPGYPLMVRAVDFNRLRAKVEELSAAQAELAAMRAGGEPVGYIITNTLVAGDRAIVFPDKADRAPKIFPRTPVYTHPKPAAQDAELLDWLGNQYVTVRIPLPYGSRECFIGSPDDNDGAAPSPWDIRAAIRTAIAAQQGDSHE